MGGRHQNTCVAQPEFPAQWEEGGLMGRNEGAGLQGSFPDSVAKERGDGPNPASVLSGAKPRVLGAVQARVDAMLVELTIQDESNALSLPFTW